MKILLTAASALALTAPLASAAQSLMLDFGPNTVTASALTTSPGHSVGTIPLADTTWNSITTSSTQSSLNYANGTSATGVSVSIGQETTGGNNIINYSTAITNLTLTGSGGGTASAPKLIGTGSIYGQDSATINTAGRDGFFGSGTATSTGTAIGLRIDGLAVGNYVIYVMARNTNSNDPAKIAPMNIYSSVGTSAGTFDFSALSPTLQSNTNYTTATYTNQYTLFTSGETYVAMNVSIASGQSLFLAIDGANSTVDRRGFLNAVQLVAVPEPSTYAVGMLGLLTAVTISRRRKQARA